MYVDYKKCPDSLHNLTDIEIPTAVKICIMLGLKFNFSLKPNFRTIYHSIAEGIRKYAWRVFFMNKNTNREEMDELTKVCVKIKKSISTTRLRCPIETVLFGANFANDCVKKLKDKKCRNNIAHEYLLEQLEKFLITHKVVIKPSDKNAGVVIMKQEDYECEISRQLNDLNTYIPTTQAHFDYSMQTFRDKAGYLNNIIFKNFRVNLKTFIPNTAQPANFYILPKVHKAYTIFPVGRPICSNVCTVNRGIAILLDAILRPLTVHISTLLIDTPHLLTLIENIKLDQNKKYVIVAADIQAMYQELPIDICKKNCILFFNKFKNVTKFPFEITEQQLSILLNFSLDYSFVKFKTELFFQKRGIQMGNNSSVSVANITAAIELDSLWKSEMIFRRRFIDDILAIVEVTNISTDITEWFNSVFQHPFLKFTLDWSYNEVNFLDLKIMIGTNNEITTSIYSKPMSKHEYLHYYSNHPEHMKKSLPYSCGLRVIRSCSNEEDRSKNLELMFNKFLRRKYPIELIMETKEKLSHLERKVLITPSSSFHHAHINIHDQDIAIMHRQTSQSTNTNNVFFILPFYKLPNFKYTIKSNIENILRKCSSVKLRKLALDLNVNTAFTIPNPISRCITCIEKKKERHHQQSGLQRR